MVSKKGIYRSTDYLLVMNLKSEGKKEKKTSDGRNDYEIAESAKQS